MHKKKDLYFPLRDHIISSIRVQAMRMGLETGCTFTCVLEDHSEHHHLVQVQLLLSYTPAEEIPNIPFDLQHCNIVNRVKNHIVWVHQANNMNFHKRGTDLVLLSKKPAVILWLATPSLCSAAALTCSSTV